VLGAGRGRCSSRFCRRRGRRVRGLHLPPRCGRTRTAGDPALILARPPAGGAPPVIVLLPVPATLILKAAVPSRTSRRPPSTTSRSMQIRGIAGADAPGALRPATASSVGGGPPLLNALSQRFVLRSSGFFVVGRPRGVGGRSENTPRHFHRPWARRWRARATSFALGPSRSPASVMITDGADTLRSPRSTNRSPASRRARFPSSRWASARSASRATSR